MVSTPPRLHYTPGKGPVSIVQEAGWAPGPVWTGAVAAVPDHNLFAPVNGKRRMRWAGHVARMGEDRGVHRVLVGKPEGKSPLGRPRRRWEDNIKMDLREVGGGRGDWMELAQDRDRWRALVGTVRDFRVP